MELSFKDLTKYYGNLCALDNFTVDMRPGIYGLLGPNGAGKSTLMKLMTDLIPRSSGSILYDGEEILTLGRRFRHKLGYMPQNTGFYEDYTSRQYLQYIGSVKELDRHRVTEQIPELLQTLNLSPQADRKIKKLSGGMRQRVMLAQAMLGSPEILILDEPTAGLDPEERINIRNHLFETAENKIVLMATHIVSDLESIADYILILSHGRLIQQGTPAALIDGLQGKVWERICEPSELPELQKQYEVSRIETPAEGILARFVGDRHPEDAVTVKNRISLEDVYLFYNGVL